MGDGGRFWLAPFVAAVIAPLVLLQFGFDGFLERDDSVYMYSGQQMAAGVPPYASVFDQKGPLVPMLCGWGVMAARALGVDDLLVVRGLFLVLTWAGIVALAGYAQTLLQAPRSALLTALTLLAFTGFTRFACAGPQPKTPIVVLQILSLWLTARRNWFAAGACSTLAFLVWQPMGVFPLVTFVLALLRPAGERWRAAGRCVAGGAIVTAPIVAYFVWKGALGEMLDGVLMEVLSGILQGNLAHEKSGGLSFNERLWTIYMAVSAGFPALAYAIWVGLASAALFYGARRAAHASWAAMLRDDPWAAFLLTLPAPVLWSLADFQWYPDFYPLLPYAAVGIGWLLEQMLRGVEWEGGPARLRRGRVLAVVLGVALVAVAALELRRAKLGVPTLTEQRAAAAQIMASFGADAPFVSIGAPELLVLLQRTNPNPYPFMLRGIDRRVAARTPGGFAGFLRQIEQHRPAFIAFGQTTGDHVDELLTWLEARYATEQFGPFTILTPRAR